MKSRGAFMNTKGFVSVHTGTFFIVGVILGMGLMYFLILKGIVPISLPVKP